MQTRRIAVLAPLIVLVLSSTALAQREFGARAIILDDNNGHLFRIQTPGGMTGNTTYTLPLAPPGNPPAGFVGMGVEGQTMRWDSLTGSWQATSHLFNTADGMIGIGTTRPLSPVHIVAMPPTPSDSERNSAGFLIPSPRHHVLTVENRRGNGMGNGIAIIIRNPASSDIMQDGRNNDNRTNYLTFYNDDGDSNNIKGRIEGFSSQNYKELQDAILEVIDEGALLNPLNYIKFNLSYDPDFLGYDNGFIDFVPPTFPDFDAGSFPSLRGGSWPHLSGGSFFWEDWPSLSGGSWPYLSGGTLPSMTGGSVGSLTVGNPFPDLKSPIDGLSEPFSWNDEYIDGITAQLGALPYKKMVAEIVTNPVAAGITFGSSFMSGVTYESGSGDYAEWLERQDLSERIGIAEVVAVNGGKITKNTEGATQYMVTSWKPIVLGNMPDPDRAGDFEKVAFMGQVPVKMRGAVTKGDYIIPSGKSDGFAIAVAPGSMTAALLGDVLGVAWEDDYRAGTKLVKVAVGLKPHEMVRVIQSQAEEIESLKSKMQDLDKIKSDLARIKTELGLRKMVKR